MRKIPSIIALLCILVYTASVVFAAYRIYRGIERQKETAGTEVDSIAGIISQNSAVFFDENSRRLIQEKVDGSEALEGIIITGSIGDEFAFEKKPGGTIVRDGNTPGFAKRLGIAYLPAQQVDVQGLRNVNIYSAYNTVNYALFVETLKQSLAAILAALLVAFLTLILSSTLKKENPEEARLGEAPDGAEAKTIRPETAYPEAPRDYVEETDNRKTDNRKTDTEETDNEEDLDDDFDFTDFSGPEDSEPFGEAEDIARGSSLPDFDEDIAPDFDENAAVDFEDEVPDFDENAAAEKDNTGGFDDFALDDFLDEDSLKMPGEESSAKTDAVPQGLYSPKSGIGWENYTMDRLASEIHRCAASEQDLVVLLFECGKDIAWDDELYKKLSDEAVRFFNLKDLTFEKGSRGISVIIPNTDLDQGIIKAEEFHARVLKNLPGNFTAKTDLRAGISSRSGRLIDADRLFFEAASALEKAKGGQPIVAFKSNPEKYRNFIRKSQS
ncbi:MAG: hypothetical protein LBP29_09550 [Treponema sp.]|jgi:hypothetical protein|nr:hypothetical protein [Treponema sp.]